MNSAERVSNSRAVLDLCGFRQRSDGVWVGKYYAATITDIPDTTPLNDPNLRPGMVIEFSRMAAYNK